MSNENPKPSTKGEETLRPHSYDGIQEYDQRLPNWWLWTLYGAVMFSIGYWVVLHQMNLRPEPGVALAAQMDRNTLEAARSSGVVTSEQLWKMSRETNVTLAGREIAISTCAACHKPDLSGSIGPNLLDEIWLHGGSPAEIVHTITNGVPAKGMPAWGPILGKAKINEVAAYILSFHQPPPITSDTPQASTR